MRNFLILLKHEIRLLVISPSSYIAATLFFILLGLLYWGVVRGFTVMPQEDSPVALFYRLFWLPVFFTVPLLTMRSLAEDRRQGTLESLLSTGVSAFSVILSKFFAAYFLYLLLWILTLTFPIIAVWQIPGQDWQSAAMDGPALLGSLLFIAVSGFLYISVGIFSSSLTRSQLVSGMLSFTFLFVLIIGGRLIFDMPLDSGGWSEMLAVPLEYLNVFRHLEDFSLGIIDTRPFLFYFSTTFLLLGMSTLVVESKL